MKIACQSGPIRTKIKCLLNAFDSGKSAFLVMMFNLSAEFDTVSILKLSFGIDGIVLCWIKSYLENRRSKVKAGTAYSEVKEPNIKVAQGSVLGPVLFNCVMAGLSPVLESLGVLWSSLWR